MLHTIIKENSYQDSVNLMLLTNKLSTMEGVKRISVMMGTPANVDIFRNTGLYTDQLKKAKPNDMCIVLDTDQDSKVEEVLSEIDNFLKNQAISNNAKDYETVRTWDKAIKSLQNANIAIISVPGQYAPEEVEKALNNGLHAFVFSDNVPIEEEVRLKQKGKEKGLLVMGPDCGTGVLGGVPMAFANVIADGNIGIVGASGTGIQEVTTIIDRLGGGITHAIGTGGRDLSDKVGAITMLEGIKGLENHPGTEVIVVISKPPAKEVRDHVTQVLQSLSKPSVAIFIGEKPEYHEGNVWFAHTLEETAVLAVELAKGNKIVQTPTKELTLPSVNFKPEQTAIKGLYSGGTLAGEAAMLITEALGLEKGSSKEEGYQLKSGSFIVVDLGDDIYTQGKPHPMIDPDTRIKFMEEAANDESTAVILFDVVLGYGSHEDMAGALLPTIKKIQSNVKASGREIAFVSTVCGTDKDPQSYKEQWGKLKNAGVIMMDSNVQAVKAALKLIGKELEEVSKEHRELSTPVQKEDLTVSDAIKKLLSEKPMVVNVGLKKFTNAIINHGGQVVQFDWRPVAGGNEKMRKLLTLLQ